MTSRHDGSGAPQVVITGLSATARQFGPALADFAAQAHVHSPQLWAREHRGFLWLAAALSAGALWSMQKRRTR